MKCPRCGKDNKGGRESCKNCKLSFTEDFKPSLKWDIKVLGIIYILLIALYFIAKVVL